MPANVYIDGFNFYYGAVRNTPYKWLNLRTLVEGLFPNETVNRIRYFTARSTGLPHDPGVPLRQENYFRALRTIPGLTIHEGRFVSRDAWFPMFPIAYPPGSDRPVMAHVFRTEEKGSDVNLATYLLLDCCRKDMDHAIVITNDSDLAEPIRIVAKELGCPVTVVNPHYKNGLSHHLREVATSAMPRINKKHFIASQFPDHLTDAKGSFSKPSSW